MTDPVETLARALTAMWYDGRDDRLTEHTYDKARALLAQITPAIVAEAVAKERRNWTEAMESYVASIRARSSDG
jgi:hypothetical protein